MAEGEAVAKIFVSYTSKDCAEAAWIAADFPRARGALDEIADRAAQETIAPK